jgi:hypothetical protein
MNLRTLFILAAVVMALALVAPVNAAPLVQASVDEETSLDEVVVTSTSTFTLTVLIDDVTTLAIPMQVDWRAEGPNAGTADEVLVRVSPTVLRTGIFSVTVGSVEPMTGTLAVTLTQQADEIAPITRTATTTATGTITANTIVSAPVVNTATATTVSNLRAGPGTEYAIVGSVEADATLDVVGQNSDGTWLALANGAWIAAFLVANAPADLPIVEPTVTPLPSPVASTVLTPTVTPTIMPTITPTP